MAVKKAGEKYVCNICGNEVVVTRAEVISSSAADNLWKLQDRDWFLASVQHINYTF